MTSITENHKSAYCWILERVPGGEDDQIILPNDKEVVTLGSKMGKNDKTCLGPNVSRRHLQFVRYVRNMLIFLFSKCFL